MLHECVREVSVLSVRRVCSFANSFDNHGVAWLKTFANLETYKRCSANAQDVYVPYGMLEANGWDAERYPSCKVGGWICRYIHTYMQ
jgi:hypothetical protein